jgi:hypothetical protein
MKTDDFQLEKLEEKRLIFSKSHTNTRVHSHCIRVKRAPERERDQ